jgi:hypothetical protein
MYIWYDERLNDSLFTVFFFVHKRTQQAGHTQRGHLRRQRHCSCTTERGLARWPQQHDVVARLLSLRSSGTLAFWGCVRLHSQPPPTRWLLREPMLMQVGSTHSSHHAEQTVVLR